MNDTALMWARALGKEYGKGAALVRAVDQVDLDIERSETVAIVGPSGCGKSTLLYLLGGLERPTRGELRLAGQRIDRMSETALARLRRHSVGFVFQAFHLVDKLSAVENVELPALLTGSSPRTARRRANELLEQVGLADRAGHLPSALSGGQCQRVAIARALVGEPLVVLADEPTGNLDSAATVDVLRLFDGLRSAGQTLVIVTHDSRIAATADRLISMRDGALVDETRLSGGSARSLADLVGLEGVMGRVLLVYRLAVRDLRRHAAQSALLLLVIAATTTALTLGLVLHGVTSSPWQRTFAATDGPDVVAQFFPPYKAVGPSATSRPKQLAALAHAAGVTGSSGPYPTVNPNLAAHGSTFSVFAEGRGPDAGIDRPYLTAGTWVRPGGVVLDRNVADAFGLGPGDAVTLGGRAFHVAGVAVTAAWGETSVPGLVWVTRADARRLASRADPLAYTLNLRLADPAAASAFAAAHSTGNLFAMPWQQVQQSDNKVISIVQLVMLVGTWLLGLLAVASMGVLVGARMADQTRRVGLLKAVGATPKLVAVVLLAEHLLLALAATVLGLAVGWLAAPLLSTPSDALLGAAGAPSITASVVLVTLAVAVGVAVLATLVPAVRAARATTIRSLNDPARPPRRRPVVNAASSRLPVPLLLGLRLAARRPRRSVLTVVSLVITVAMIVTALTMRYGFDVQNAGVVPDPLNLLTQNRVSQVVAVLTVILGVLAAVNMIFITQATVSDAQRASALARAFGTTPRQVTAGLCVAQLVPALAGVILGIPAGLGLYQLAASRVVVPPLWWLLAVLPGTLLVVAVLTAIPARIGARRPVALVLRTE